MCGIAGYNASEKFTQERITPEIQRNLLEAAWLNNLHRGTDAAGYFAVYPKSERLKVFKQGRSGQDILDDYTKELVPARVFGAHTRAATQGGPEKNYNNHPVYYNGIWVTHNGVIRNDDKVRMWLPEQEQKKLPEVDSVAINIVLDAADGHLDELKDIGDLLYSELNGSYAFHAIWKEHPGVSLLTRGASSPLVVALHPEHEIVLYASQYEALWYMIDALGLKAYDPKWAIQQLDTYKMLLIEDGRPINWVSFTRGWHGVAQAADKWISRLLPSNVEDEPFDIVYSTDKTYDFAFKNGGLNRDISRLEDKNLEIIYTRKEGFIDPKRKFPLESDHKLGARLAEADAIVRVKGTSSEIFHAFFGDVEIIVSNSDTIYDVYNHALDDEFDGSGRWYVERKEDIINELEKDFTSFMKKYSTNLTVPMQAPAIPFFKRQVQQLPLNQGRQTPKKNDTKSSSETPKDTVDTSKKITGEWSYWKADPILTWDNLFIVCDSHIEETGFFFVEDVECPKHHEKLSIHSDPRDCEFTKVMAAYAWSCCRIIDLVPGIAGGAHGPYIANEITGTSCGDDGASKAYHDFYIIEEGRVRFSNSNRYFDIPLIEECIHCHDQKVLRGIPQWLEEFMERHSVAEVIGVIA